jgi:phosphonate transport system ATP-binding protein
MMNEPVIRLSAVHVLYGSVCALDVESLEIAAGERVFVLGHSGSGKTTMSRLIKGRSRPSTGRVQVLGKDPSDAHASRRHKRRVAMIDQDFHLVPRLSVIGNVLTGSLGRVGSLASLAGIFPAREWDRAESILCEVGLEGLGERRVESLSGGQRQRTAIARALMQDADIILADEPVSNLDPELAEDALELFVDCVSRRGVTLLVNLHQPELARRFASRFVGLANGRIVFDGTPESFTAADAELVYRGRPSLEDKEKKDDFAPTLVPADRDAKLRLVGR